VLGSDFADADDPYDESGGSMWWEMFNAAYLFRPRPEVEVVVNPKFL